MYNSENTWLAAFNELNNKLKHQDLSYASETFELHLEKPESSLMWESEDLVRKSCKEVERLVLYFLSKEVASTDRRNAPCNESDDNLSLSNLFL